MFASLPAPDGPDRAPAPGRDYRQVWEASPLAFVIVDGDGRVTSVSPAGGRLFAATPNRLVGARFLDLVEPMDRATADDMLRRAAEGQTPPRQEIRFVRPHGEIVIGGLSVARYAESESGERLAVIRDLSHEQTLRPNLLQTEKLATLGAVAATVAHEVNNPLMGASSSLQELRETLQTPEQHELLQTALAEIDRAARIVRDLRQFSHRGEEPRQRIEPAELLAMAAKLHATTHGSEVPVAIACAPDAPAFDGVRNQFLQALRNLLRNAHQAMADTPAARRRIVLNARRKGADALAIDVVDAGHGVPQHLRSRIFEAFFSTKNSADGTGLGLTVVQAVASAHGGRVDLEDTPGGGATFTLVVPAAPAAAAAPATAPAAASRPTLPDGFRLLIVDDEAAIRGAISRFCRRANATVQIAEAHDAASAEAALAQQEFDIVLLDRHFPGGGAPAVVAAMARLRPGLVARTVLISGALEEDAGGEIGAGYGAALQKPFDLKELLRTFTALLGKQG